MLGLILMRWSRECLEASTLPCKHQSVTQVSDGCHWLESLTDAALDARNFSAGSRKASQFWDADAPFASASLVEMQMQMERLHPKIEMLFTTRHCRVLYIYAQASQLCVAAAVCCPWRYNIGGGDITISPFTC